MVYILTVEHMVRGQKIETPFDGGIPARIYFAAYLKPRNGYQLAREVFGTKEESKQPKTPSKIYKYIKDHPNYFHRKYKDNSDREYVIHASLDPLLDQMPPKIFEIAGDKADEEPRDFIREYLAEEVRETLAEGYRWNFWKGFCKEEEPALSEDPNGEIIKVFLEFLKLASGARLVISEASLDECSRVTEEEIARWALKGLLSHLSSDEKEKILDRIEPLFDLIDPLVILDTPSLRGSDFGKFYPKVERIMDLTEFTYLIRQKMRERLNREDRKRIKEKEKKLNETFRKAVEKAVVA